MISKKNASRLYLPSLLSKNLILLSILNEKLACSDVGVFALWTPKYHEILDIQQNSGCDPCPSQLLFPFSSPPRIPAWPESGGNRVSETQNQISLIHFENGSLESG